MTIDIVEKLWEEFEERVDRAEQYQFPDIMFFHLRLEAMYKDLHVNWNEDHAKIFMNCIKIAYEKLGWRPSEIIDLKKESKQK